MKPRQLAHIAMVGITLIYAGGFSITKIILPELLQARGFILIRVTVTAILFWVFFAVKPKNEKKIERKDFGRIAFCGLFGVALNQLFFFEGLARTTPVHAALMMLTTPILVGIMASFILKEKISINKIIGIILGLFGAFILISNSSSSALGSNPALGDFFVFINAVSYSLYLVTVKPLMNKYAPLTVIRWVFLFGALMVFPFGIGQFLQIDWSLFTRDSYLVLAYVVFIMTFLAYLWNVFAVKELPATVVGSYIYLQPVFASVIAILFFSETMTWDKIVSAIFIFAGVYLVSKKMKAA